jgi:DNA repair protein RecN (Recombination protein N)
MLKSLYIKNYALIDEISLDFNNDFTVISGDTGSGKSILLNSISLLFGKRLEKNYTNDKKCIVEAVFKIDATLKAYFSKHNLDFESETIIRREITAKGISRIFINDTPVTLIKIKELSTYLIEIHSQNESLLIKEEDEQINILDRLANNHNLIEKYQNEFIIYNNFLKSLHDIKSKSNLSSLELDFFKFQLQELIDVNLENDEKEIIEKKLLILSNSEDISKLISSSSEYLSSDLGIISNLNKIYKDFLKFENFSNLTERIHSNIIDLNDISDEILSYRNNLDSNPLEINKLSSRLNVLNNLFLKHRVTSIDELFLIIENLEKKILSFSNYSQNINDLNLKINDQLEVISKLADKITFSRKKVCNKFEREIEQTLKSLSIPHASFKISVEKRENYNFTGNDFVEFCFSANKGNSVKSLSSVASGGEVSRLMLAIKFLLSKDYSNKTLIFDEIDTGVSGDIASYMGDLMKKISFTSQLLSITHLPQIASKSDFHIKVFKKALQNSTVTRAVYLEGNDRVVEIAKLLSGKSISDAAILNAKELLNQ